jgi:hypothetical protein
MPLIQNHEIAKVIDLFNERGVKIYHACQYRDFKTYLALGGVPSRNLMESSGLPYTPFDTDNVDKNNEVWSMVFGNLSDFGFSFAQAARNERTAPVPNPYGPILLVFEPEVLSEAEDVAICLRSAGGRDFNREIESLGSASEVDRIFTYSIENAPSDYAKAYVKFDRALRTEFGNDQAKSPEVSCTVNNERFSFNHLAKIEIDPYVVNGQNLFDKVRDLKQRYDLNGAVWKRFYKEGRLEIEQELADLLLQKVFPINEIAQSERASEVLRDWASRVIRGQIDWQFDRFARYLRIGTILELYNENS